MSDKDFEKLMELAEKLRKQKQGFFMPREDIDFIGWLESNIQWREAI